MDFELDPIAGHGGTALSIQDANKKKTTCHWRLREMKVCEEDVGWK